MKSRFSKRIALITSTVLIILAFHPDHNFKDKHKVVEASKDEAIFQYHDGYIYIGDAKYLGKIEGLGPHDVLVLDERDNVDPNMKIINSCLIDDKDARNEILNSLLEYESMYPTSWNRTLESLRNEWSVHNILHHLHYKRYRTTDIDLNNGDEETFDGIVLKKIFFN